MLLGELLSTEAIAAGLHLDFLIYERFSLEDLLESF